MDIAFRHAMRRLTSTISIVTARGQEDTGVVMTSVASLSMSPLSLMVAVNKNASAHAAIDQSRCFCVNLLHADHAPLVAIFSGGQRGAARFEHGAWAFEPEGARLLDAVASLVCDADGQFDYGTHTIFVGRVRDVVLGQDRATLLWRAGAVVSQLD
jgi:flavin reductase (DIM6/NTAB) family NADH-FMN oxidoreductase RutF